MPDGYWDMNTHEGGIGAVLLLPDGPPRVYGCMLPHYLRKQLRTSATGEEEKQQRNTQAELLAILVVLLTWGQLLQGCSLVIATDSSAAEGNLLNGSAGDPHSQWIITHIWLLIVVFDIQVYVVWIPSKQNPGDPFSRPTTAALERGHLVKVFGIKVDTPRTPSQIKAEPERWLEAMNTPLPWSATQRAHFMANFGVTKPEMVREVLETMIKPEGAQVIRLGFFPRHQKTGQGVSALTSHHPELVRLFLTQCKMYLGTNAITAIVVEQDIQRKINIMRNPMLQMTFKDKWIHIQRWRGQSWQQLATYQVPSSTRCMRVTCGTDSDFVNPSTRLQLRAAGFDTSQCA